jgi:hypothetical protein
MKRLLLVCLVCFVGACAGSNQTRATNSLAIACDAYSTVLDQLTPLRAAGKLSASLVSKVNAVNEKVKPVCGTDSVVDPASAVTMVENAITLLKSVKESI